VPDGISISILSYLEAYQGVIESLDPDVARVKFDAFLRGVPVLPVSPEIARRCAEIRSLLKRQGKSSRRRAFDLVIAATALEHGLTLVTHNAQDFQDISGLIRYEF
jgi:predicted nucleic acid-binding protein